jgi:arylamine N-acetyltransferase
MFLDHFGLSPVAPDRDELESILAEFSRIPWENLTKYLQKAMCIPPGDRLRDPHAVISGHIHQGTGGTCFSLTEALGAILSFTGFRCAPVMADMHHGRNIHCGLAVHTSDGGRFLADPGYLVPFPVPLVRGRETEMDIHGQKLLWKPSGGDVFDLSTSDGGGFSWRYTVRMDPVGRKEFLGHWQESFDASGMNSLHANLRVGPQRISAHNMNLRRTDCRGKRNEKLRDSYSLSMEQNFGISRRIAMQAEAEWTRACQDR